MAPSHVQHDPAILPVALLLANTRPVDEAAPLYRRLGDAVIVVVAIRLLRGVEWIEERPEALVCRAPIPVALRVGGVPIQSLRTGQPPVAAMNVGCGKALRSGW